MNRRTVLTSAMAFTFSIGASKTAFAQLSLSRPMRAIIPVPLGSAVDAYARVISEFMARALGRVIIVENKPGAGGSLSARFVVNAPADGNLILVATQALTEINPSAFRDAKWSMSDLIPLIRGVQAPLVLVTNPTVPAKTLVDLVAWIKSNPGKLSYSSYNAGTPSHFLGFQLNERFGLDLFHVPSKGSGTQATDLIAGNVLFGFAQEQSTLPLIREGKLNAIGVTSAARSRFLPSVPTFRELGHDEFTASIWFGLMVRVGTPPGILESLLNACRLAHADPEVRAKLEAQGFEVSGETGPGFAADIKAQTERWARLVKASGFTRDGD